MIRCLVLFSAWGAEPPNERNMLGETGDGNSDGNEAIIADGVSGSRARKWPEIAPAPDIYSFRQS